MYLILDKTDCVRAVSDAITYAKVQPNGYTTATTREDASLVYAASDDSFYSLREGFHVWELAAVPAGVSPGTWFFRDGALVQDPAAVEEKARATTQEPVKLRADLDYVLLMGGF